MGVATGGGEALMPEGLLDEVGRRATVEGVGGVGVPEPVEGDVLFDTGLAGELPELSATTWAVGLLRTRHRIIGRAKARAFPHG